MNVLNKEKFQALFLLWLRLEPNGVHSLVPPMPGQGFQLIAASRPVTSEQREQAVLPPRGPQYICSSAQGAEDRQHANGAQHNNAK